MSTMMLSNTSPSVAEGSDPPAHNSSPKARSRLERALSLFSEVRAGEGVAALILTLDLFVLLTTYYSLKVVREPLILLGGAFGFQGKFPVLVAFPFFAWLGIFSLMIVGQFWSLANDLYSEEEGKRLFPIVAFGGTSGAVAGAWVGGELALGIGPYQVMLVAAGLLLL